MVAKQRTAILISGRGSNMSALIEAAKAEDYPAEIVLVLSNRTDAGGLEVARAAGIRSDVVRRRDYASRDEQDKAINEILHNSGISIICLAGFMHILATAVVEDWRGRMINVHPSLLPAYPGLDTHERALADGVRLHGCSTHFVTPELDAGPIIMQAATGIAPTDTRDSLAARVLALEHAIYPRTLALVASGAARLDNGRCVIDGAREASGTLISPGFEDVPRLSSRKPRSGYPGPIEQ